MARGDKTVKGRVVGGGKAGGKSVTGMKKMRSTDDIPKPGMNFNQPGKDIPHGLKMGKGWTKKN